MTDTNTTTLDAAIYEPDSLTNLLPLEHMFPKQQTLEVDIGCGKGRFLVARASDHLQRNYLGIDRSSGRVRSTSRKVVRAGLSNVRLVRIEASYAVRCLLPEESVSTVYIFFPDPWPKRRHHKNRLFNQTFVDALYVSLCPAGVLHVATDHADYFQVITKLFLADQRFETAPTLQPSAEEHTNFQLTFEARGRTTNRCSFKKIC